MKIKTLFAKALRVVLQPPAIKNSKINKKAKICSGSQINNSILGKYSYIGHDVFVLNATIGPFCSIADNCRIGGHEHDYKMVSVSPVFFDGKNILKKNFSNFIEEKTKPITIGADVWIGAGSIIKSGVSIGTGAIVGAGSVVTHDVPPYEIWAGNPAKKIKNRFEERLKTKLLESKWWELSDCEIENIAGIFNSPLDFIDKIDVADK